MIIYGGIFSIDYRQSIDDCLSADSAKTEKTTVRVKGAETPNYLNYKLNNKINDFIVKGKLTFVAIQQLAKQNPTYTAANDL